jgi:hypothetical protein
MSETTPPIKHRYAWCALGCAMLVLTDAAVVVAVLLVLRATGVLH